LPSEEAALAKELAIVLGKALFWDMQVGSDDVQACASCHFNAGADFRTKNQLTPSDDIFGEPPNEIGIFGDSAIDEVPGPNDPPFNYGFGPNFDLTAEHFPFHRRSDPTGAVILWIQSMNLPR
jgi:cytochrome c peroxidase